MSECEINIFGTKRWYYNGELHRVDGPAIEYVGGSKEWYQDGKRHREDGPAVEWSNGKKEWFWCGNKCTKDEFVLLQFSRGIIEE